MKTNRTHKKNLIVSYKNLSDDLKELFREMYPDGYTDYLQSFVKPNGETIHVVPFETEDTAYMVKFEVKIDTMGGDLDKALFDDDDDDKEAESEFAPLSEALEKEEADPTHKERVLRHGDFQTNLEEDEERRRKLAMSIDKDEIKAAFDDDGADEDDSYLNDDDDLEPDDDDFEPSDEDLRGIEEEYLDAEIPPLDATIPDEELAETLKPAAGKGKKNK